MNAIIIIIIIIVVVVVVVVVIIIKPNRGCFICVVVILYSFSWFRVSRG